ncbi:PAS domain-containing sensor histidine kinase [Pseudoalteromonas sp. McH1-7]|uniref:PAS domain-containing sensor histidine kinase n=1 Tax=Pseudoalteromonas TaxID=53246 RepID=UPI00158FCE6B|nr:MULTISPECIES: PAS domain-containing sensor histidine kinase [Pseudoalteromonas]MDW7548798.1 PAS domain-containing sensor histidine kinase [Pseudoalteromonas peptidolytica]NUZ10945.1 PAS domain-containing sensor histidine kinase [Pseudoalteromonas sp. McH1-7]USD30487.1 PAS domain-containing sensor histidine kinase [Pseudoalteromonas sp. SCSIO 43201]
MTNSVPLAKAERFVGDDSLSDLIFDNIPDYAFIKDDKFRIVKANDAFRSMYPESAREKIIGYTTLESYHPEEVEAFIKDDKLAFASGYAECYETVTFPDGGVRTLFTRKKRFYDANGAAFILGLSSDVTEREHLVVQLRRSNDALDEFAYIASHDLKAPLNAISKLVTWIDEDELPEGAKENFALIQQRVSRMNKLLHDLLIYSRVNRKHSECETFEFSEFSQEIYDSIDIESTLTLQCVSLMVTLPKTALEVVTRNLISNALKHHHCESGNLIIDIKETPELYQLHFTDDGPGIPKEYREKVFEMFQTLKPRDQQEGSGMGLAIIKKVLDYYGGSIEILDTGVGAEFVIKWPKVDTRVNPI